MQAFPQEGWIYSQIPVDDKPVDQAHERQKNCVAIENRGSSTESRSFTRVILRFSEPWFYRQRDDSYRQKPETPEQKHWDAPTPISIDGARSQDWTDDRAEGEAKIDPTYGCCATAGKIICR